MAVSKRGSGPRSGLQGEPAVTLLERPNYQIVRFALPAMNPHMDGSFQVLSEMFRNEADLEDTRPQFAGDKQTLSIRIVGNSVQHRARFHVINRAQKAFEINPANNPTTLRRDPGDSISLPHVGENLALHELEFVQLFDGSIAILDCEMPLFLKRAGVQNADRRAFRRS